MRSWNELSMAEKADIMKLAIEGGVYDLDSIRMGYNKFAEGGSKGEKEEVNTNSYSVGNLVNALYQNNPKEKYLGEPEHHYDFTQSEEWANAHGYYPDARGHRDDRVKKVSHPSHPSRGTWDGDKFVLTDFGMQNPNYTLFGLTDGGQDPQATLIYNNSVVLPELTVTPNENYFYNPYDNIELHYAKGGKIHIKPENRGKFTALKERTGHSATWFKEHGTPAQKKMATFALNARKWKHGDGGNLFDGTSEDSQQMDRANIFRRPNGEYFYQASPDSEEVTITPLNTLFENPALWTYTDANGKVYSPRQTPSSTQGSIIEKEDEGPLVEAAKNYLGELQYDINNGVPIGGKYTLPAIAAAAALPVVGEAAASILANPYVDAGLTSAFAGHGLHHWANEGIDGLGDATMTALELMPLGRVAKPVYEGIVQPGMRLFNSPLTGNWTKIGNREYRLSPNSLGSNGSPIESRVVAQQITAENAASMTPEQWTAAQDAAIARGDMAEAQRLRDLHFKVSAPPNIPFDEAWLAASKGRHQMGNLVGSNDYASRVRQAYQDNGIPVNQADFEILQAKQGIEDSNLKVVPNLKSENGEALNGQYDPNTRQVLVSQDRDNILDVVESSGHEHAHASEVEKLLELLKEKWKHIKPRKESFTRSDGSIDTEWKDYISKIIEMRAPAMSVWSEMKELGFNKVGDYLHHLKRFGLEDKQWEALVNRYGLTNAKYMVETVFGFSPLIINGISNEKEDNTTM